MAVKVAIRPRIEVRGRPIPAAALALIRRWEGLRLRPYYDTAGIPTIGYGHVLSWNPEDRWRKGRGRRPPASRFLAITEAQAVAWLEAEVPKYAAFVCNLIRAPMTDGMYAGLISFTYNVGPTNLRLSTLRRMINRGEAIDAGEQFLRWVYDARRNKLAGLLNRRRDERAAYLSDIHMLKEESLAMK